MRRALLLIPFLAACGGSPAPAAAPPRSDAPPTSEAVRAEGYGGVVFEARAGAVEVVSPDGERRVLAEGVDGPRAMVRVGGTLFVGTAAGAIESVSLASGEVARVAGELGRVRAMVLDHQGYLLVASDDGLRRVAPHGDVTPLGPQRAETLSLDLATRRLALGPGPETLDYLALVGDDAATWEARDARVMRPFELRGVELTGAEYWPYRGDAEPDYPADVLWGFYPEQGVVFEGEPAPATATDAAVACAEESYAALRAWIESATDAQLRRLADGAPRFYLWVNDYSTASDPFPHEVRPARVWFWRRDPAVEGRVPGYWKWETTLTQDGVCHVPEQEQIARYLREWEG